MVRDWKSGTYTEGSGTRANRSRTPAAHIGTQKQQTVPHARGDSLLQYMENRETMVRKVSEQAAYAKTVENGPLYKPNDSVMERNSSTLLCRDHPEQRNSQSSRLQAVLTDHVKVGPEIGIEVFKYAGTLVIEVRVPSQQPGN